MSAQNYFHHTRSARAEGKQGLLLAFALLTFGGIILFIAYNGIIENRGRGILGLLFAAEVFPLLLLGLPLALVALFVLSISTLRLIAGGRWEVIIDAETLQWREPDFANESFQLPLDDIDKFTVLTTSRAKRSGKVKQRTSYTVKKRNGESIHLLNQSGIDMEAFTRAMAKAGVSVIQETHLKRKT